MGSSKTQWLAGESEMAARIRAFEWGKTPLGALAGWPQSLRAATSLLVNSRHPMWIGWGEIFTFLYNDAYRPALGAKHPQALSLPARAVWPDIGSRIETVRSTGVATYHEDELLFRENAGFREETYQSLSYSALADDAGAIAGVLCLSSDSTEQVIGARRLATLNQLSVALAGASTQNQVWAAVKSEIEANSKDLPFLLVYLFERGDRRARLVCATGFSAGHPGAPENVDSGTPGEIWNAGEMFDGSDPIAVQLPPGPPAYPSGAWNRPPQQAIVIPIRESGKAAPAGFAVAGVNPHRHYDPAYAGFFYQLTGQIAAAMRNARAREQERRLAKVLAEIDRARTTRSLSPHPDERRRLTERVSAITPVVVTLYDLVTGRSIVVSGDVMGLSGYTPEEINQIDDGPSTFWHPDDFTHFEAYLPRWKHMADGDTSTAEYRLRHRNGLWRWVVSRIVPFARDSSGQVRQVVAATFDVTAQKQATEALRASEERFRSWFELGLIGMAITSPQKGCLEVNDEICRILGYQRSELLKMTWAELTHPDDLAADLANFERVLSGEVDGYSMDKRWIRKDGQVIDSIISVKCVRRPDKSVDYFVALVQDISARKQAEQALALSQFELEWLVAERTRQLTAANEELRSEMAAHESAQFTVIQYQQELRALTGRLVEAQETESKYLARELHDDFSQKLAALGMELADIAQREASADVVNRLLRVAAHISDLNEDTHRIARHLHPAVLDDLGLAAALKSECDIFVEQYGIPAECDFHLARSVPPDVSLCLYRVTQEALRNCAEHAHATRVRLSLRQDGELVLEIADFGNGFDVESVRGKGGLGLVSMQERVRLVNGTFSIESQSGKGTVVRIRIPLRET